MTVKFFLRLFHCSVYYVLSKLNFSEKKEYFFGKVHNDLGPFHKQRASPFNQAILPRRDLGCIEITTEKDTCLHM